MIICLVGLISLHNPHTGKIIFGICQPWTVELKKIHVVIDNIHQINRNVLKTALHHFQIGVH
ncbi:hypothetical protein D3C74_417280 [compost metagenome]